MTFPIPSHVLELLQTLHSRGHSAYVVGGAIRDGLLGRRPHDFDLATSARPEEVESCFGSCRADSVGRAYGVAQVDGVEIATFRTDIYQGLDARNCEVAYTSLIEEDLVRRDLTVNAMAWDPFSGEMIDPFGGLSDAATHTVRLVGDGTARLYEDPARILRACRFLAAMEGRFAAQTETDISACTSLVRHVAPERMRAEILKALGLRRPSLFFRAMAEVGVLEYVLPSLAATVGVYGGQHQEQSVFEHCVLAGDAVSPRCRLQRLAAVLHDVAKAVTVTSCVQDEQALPEHRKAGAELAARDLRALRFTKREVAFVRDLVRLQMRPMHAVGSKSVRRLLHDLHNAGLDHRMLVRQAMADRKADKARRPYSVAMVRKMLASLEGELARGGLPMTPRSLAIGGNDLMAHLAIKPGPTVGRLIKQLRNFALDNPDLNTREALLTLAGELCCEAA